MKVTVEPISSVLVKMNVELSPETVSGAIDKIIGEFSKNAEVKGFRKGKAPRDVIVSRYKNEILDETAQELVRDTFYKAADSEKVYPLSQPRFNKIDKVARNQAFQYEAEFEVAPELVIENYKGLELTIQKSKYKQHSVDDGVAQIQKSVATRQEFNLDRPFGSDGDFADISYVIHVEDQKIDCKEGGRFAFDFTAKPTLFYTETSNALLQQELDSTVDIKVVLPDLFSIEDLRGKDAVLSLTLFKREMTVLPELDEAFAVQHGFKSMTDLRNQLQLMLNDKEEELRNEATFNSFYKIITERYSFAVPNYEVENMTSDQIYHRLSQYGMTYNKQTKAMFQSMIENEGVRKSVKPEAELSIKKGYLARFIIKSENIEVSESERESFLVDQASAHNMTLAEVKKDMTEKDYESINSKLLFERCVSKIESFSTVITEE